MSSVWDSIPWEWVGALGGLGCSALCGLVALVAVAVLAWRLTRAKADAPAPELPPEGSETERILVTVLGYRRTSDHIRARERWGRPVRYSRSIDGGARWATDAEGGTLTITERDGRPGGQRTGTPALDSRFHVVADPPELAPQLADPELRERLLALPWVHIEVTGDEVVFSDPRLTAHQRSCSPHDPESADGLAMQVRLHDGVCDVLVMVADRLG